jgi:16S rRNA (guanine966-N2)-methyltransferase
LVITLTSKKIQRVRIIGGQWRGRKLPVPEVDGLRPTPDRIRETLFNWLMMDCPGASVLDCFAGSGALGFEALSREAEHLTMIESNSSAWRNLERQVKSMHADRITLIMGDAIDLIAGLKRQFNLVFIDPPYALPQLRKQVLASLIEHRRLLDGAKIYLEWPPGEQFELPHSNLSWLKQKMAGQVNYAIAEWRSSR